MRKKLFSLFLILMVAFSSVQPVSATSSSELKKQRQEKKRLLPTEKAVEITKMRDHNKPLQKAESRERT